MMKQTNQVLGLPIMGMKEGLTKGIVVDFLIDATQKKVLHLIVKSTKGYSFQMLAIEDVLGIGADYIMTSSIENAKSIFSSPDLLQALENGSYGSDLLQASALSTSGNVMANVTEFSFDEKTGNLTTVYLEDGSEYPSTSISVLSRDIVFFDSDYLSNLEKEAADLAAAEQAAAEQAAAELAAAEQAAAEQAAAAAAEAAKEAEMPELTIFQQAQRAFLIGHNVTADISKDGKVVIAAGTTVTEETVQLAEQLDLSTELALNVD